MRLPVRSSLLLLMTVLTAALPAVAQQGPRITALFPAGAKAGETVEVSVRGGNLIGAKKLMVMGAGGVTAELVGGQVAVDEKVRPLFQNKCTSCHEARSPANRSMTADQWASTVDRMINARGADIPKDDRDKIVGYLQALAKAGQVTAKITVAKDAAPGLREVRLLTDKGASTAWSFEVSGLPEIAAAEPNSTIQQAQKVTLPVVVNGAITQSAEKDYFAFEAKKGQRFAFNLKGFRLNEQSQSFFNPVLYLYDAKGKEVGKNLGRFGLDPDLEWTAPEDGTYNLLVRDLLWRGSPSSIYRLSMGPLSMDGILTPSAARPGASVSARLMASDGGTSSSSAPFTLLVPANAQGVTMISTPMGEMPMLIRDLPDGGEPNGATGTPVALPALFKGRIAASGQVDTFRVKLAQGNAGLELYARRLGSALKAKVTVKNAKGVVVANQEATGDDDDISIPRAFPAPGEYTVEVASADGEGGGAQPYCWEALGGAPDFALTAQPDAINLAPGQTQSIVVRVTRRENLKSPITLTLQNLPPGVTASSAVVPPDDEKAIIAVTAAADATIQGAVIAVEGRADGTDGAPLMRRARPLEVYNVNNNARTMGRSSQVVAVANTPPAFTLALKDTGETLTMTPNQETQLTVIVNRLDGFKGEITLGIQGLPPGITAPNFVRVQGNQSVATITLRANGEARILDPTKRPMPNLPPVRIVVAGYLGGNGNDIIPVSTTGAIALVGSK
jgi:hypothetical protein